MRPSATRPGTSKRNTGIRCALPYFAVSVIALLAACRPESSQPLREPPEPPSSEDSIPVAPLDGKLLGDAFTFKSGRYTIDQRPGYEKIDVKLYSIATDTPCADPPGKPASVWLRRRGVTRVEPGVSRMLAKTGGEWEVHYQRFGEEGWVGNGDANALLSIDDVGPDMKIDGALSACFRDATGSCVKGKFTAVYCRIRIDAPVRGSEAMERPPQKPLTQAAQGDSAGVLAPVPVKGSAAAPDDSAAAPKAGAP